MRIIDLIVLGSVVACAALAASTDDSSHSLTQPRLFSFEDMGGKVQPVRTTEDWAILRREIVLGMERAMGPLPDRSDLGPFRFEKRALYEGQGFRP